MAAIRIATMKHRVAVCSMNDVISKDGEMLLSRSDVFHGWAKIEPKRASQFSRAGYAIDDPRRQQSHLITMRMRLDIDISASAWIFEERIQSANRWYKVLGSHDLDERGEFIVLSCRLHERGEDTTAPAPDSQEKASILQPLDLPEGVRL